MSASRSRADIPTILRDYPLYADFCNKIGQARKSPRRDFESALADRPELRRATKVRERRGGE